MTDAEPEQPSADEIMEKIERSPLGPLLRDERAMERMIFDLMARSDDEVVREMGRELREGNVSLQGLGDIPAYREAMENGLRRVGELDLAAMSDQLDEVLAEEDQGDGTGASEEAEEPDDIFQGLWHDQRRA